MSGSPDEYDDLTLAEAYTEILGAVEDAATSRRGFEEALEDNLGQIVSDFGLLKDVNQAQLDSHRRIHERLQDLEAGQIDPDELRGDRIDSDYLLDSIGDTVENLLDEYISDLDTGVQLGHFGNYKSPTFNFGVQSPQSFGGNYKSPTFNFGAMPDRGSAGSRGSGRGSNILDSWNDYDWSGWEKVNDPEFEDPWEYAESMGIEGESSGSRWPSIEVKYHGGDDEAVSFGGETVESDPSWRDTSGTGFEDVHIGDYTWTGGGATAS